MPQSTYTATIPVSAVTQTEQELASDIIQGQYMVVQNNTQYDCNLLIFKDPAAASKPIEFVLRAGSSVTYGGEMGFYRVISSATNSAASGVKPAGAGGGYQGAGAFSSASYVGYLSVAAWDQPVPLDIPQSNFSNVSASLSGPLPTGTNHIGSMAVDSMPADQGATSQSQTGAANAAVTMGIPGQAGKSIYIWGIKAGYTGGASTQNLTVQDGATTVETNTVANSYNDERSKPLKISSGSNATVTLPAGGASIVGALTVRYEIR